ncbi:MAG: hypothetical protein LBH00_00825 [Planctomycetaceae bacterium]|jgi:hypothetical protein|nr:hypothetical protein [Planctomycetaceae bacterium]
MLRFSPVPFRSVVLAGIAVLVLHGHFLCAAGRIGPVLPATVAEDAAESGHFESEENDVTPLPPPKRNPLLERPKTVSRNRRAVFDSLDPVAVVPQSFLDGGETLSAADTEPAPPVPAVRARRSGSRPVQTMPPVTVSGTGQESVLETAGNTVIPAGEFSFDELPADISGYTAGPIVQTFGMGIFDNLTLFSEVTAFKTELNNGAGSLGAGEGFNWSTPFTPQGTITAQYGIRAVQGDNFSRSARSQCFMTAGLFKRFDFTPLQGGAAFDWLHDHSSFGSVNLQQLRCELSLRTFSNLEYGFIGGFDVFQTRPSTPAISQLAVGRFGSSAGAMDVNDYYLLFIRKQLDSGGQAEFRLGGTDRGDVIVSGQGEAALTDRIAINGGFCLTAPSEGHTADGNLRERWSMSLGVVLYFRGGAVCRSTNLYRPMFDVAGNHSFFSRLIGK